METSCFEENVFDDGMQRGGPFPGSISRVQGKATRPPEATTEIKIKLRQKETTFDAQ